MIWFLAAVIVFGILILFLISKFGVPKIAGINQELFRERWARLLAQVKTPEGMALAVIDADKLLDDALKKRGFKGKTTGERLVSAQRSLSNNDAIWYAHKLRNRLVHEPDIRLKKNEAQKALGNFKQALVDLGAL